MALIEIGDVARIERHLRDSVAVQSPTSFLRYVMLPKERLFALQLDVSNMGSYTGVMSIFSDDQRDFRDYAERVRNNLQNDKRRERVRWKTYTMNDKCIAVVKRGENVISYGIGLVEGERRQLVLTCGGSGQLPRGITSTSGDFVATMNEMSDLASVVFQNYLRFPRGPKNIHFYV